MEGGKRRAVDAAAANTVRNHQIDGVTGAFFVVQRLGKDGVGRKLAASLEAMTGTELFDAAGKFGVTNAVQGRGTRDDAHADRHAVAVSQLKVLAGLDGMSGAVSKVEELALVGLAFVGNDHGALNVDIAGDYERHTGHVAVQQLKRERGLLQLGEELGVGDHGVLDDFAAAVGELLGREGGKASHVSDDNTWLPKGAS